MPKLNETDLKELETLLPYDSVIRLYNDRGIHQLSVLRCMDSRHDIDIATPDGNVLDCGIANMPLIRYLALTFGVEKIEK